MRLSRLFGATLRQPPSGTEAESHQLLLRAGYVRQLGQGLFSYLPLAHRSLAKISGILRDEMNALGGQELAMPVVHPSDVWKASGRWSSVGPELVRFKDRRDRDMALAMTHEEVVAELCRSEITSYRQLPQLVYQLQTKFRDDPRPRAGLIRVREFTMKDSYSLDRDEEGLDQQYWAHYRAYFNIFNRCALPTIAVGADVGMMGGSLAHEYMYLTPIGEDTLVLCDHCGYAANRQIAEFVKRSGAPEEPLPIEKVATPNVTTIEEVASFLGVSTSRLMKVVFFVATKNGGRELVIAAIRGDMQVNETKLVNAIGADDIRPATEEEIVAVGAVSGYGSPVGLHSKVTVIADDALMVSPNLVAGANSNGSHLRNVNLPRDFTATVVADLAAAEDGDSCLNCQHPLRCVRGVEVGNIFKLGTRYSQALGASYLDVDGTSKPIVMGSYGIGVGRLLASIAEEHHDSRGLRWPISVAPFQVHLIALGGASSGPVQETADRVYQDLRNRGIEVLYDDRDERPGVQFADADLIGIPLRLTVSKRSLANDGVEVKRRDREELSVVPLGGLEAGIETMISELWNEIDAKLRVPVKLG